MFCKISGPFGHLSLALLRNEYGVLKTPSHLFELQTLRIQFALDAGGGVFCSNPRNGLHMLVDMNRHAHATISHAHCNNHSAAGFNNSDGNNSSLSSNELHGNGHENR